MLTTLLKIFTEILKILKSQFATHSTIYNDYNADF